MDEQLLQRIVEIERLNTDGLILFGYSPTIGLYDPIDIPYEFDSCYFTEVQLPSEDESGTDKYYSVRLNADQDDFLFQRINKNKFDRLSKLYN